MKRRLNLLVFVVMLAALIYVSVQMYNVAVRESDKYQALASSQQFRSTTVKANRGTIYDKNGQVLAQSVTVYTVYVDPRTYAERDTEKEDIIVYTLSSKLGIDAEQVREKLYKDNAYQEVATGVEKSVATDIMNTMSAEGITSVGATPTAKRYYPQNDLAANVIGHLHYDGYGIYGLEAYYDEYLTGVDGKIISARDATGAEFQYKYKQSYDAQDGDSLYTNLDATIQYYTEKALESAVQANNPKNKACAIVMNCKTGAIYAMATETDYNLNAPSYIYDEKTSLALAGLEMSGDMEEYYNQRSLAWN